MNEPRFTAGPDWIRHAVFWHVYPLGFTGAEPELGSGDEPVRHRLPMLVDWLEHAVELGASGLLLGPVFASESHGYDTIDHFRVDPRLGDAEDLGALFSAAHDRGLRVVLDGVFNHVGRRFGRFAALVQHGPGAPDEPWFRVRWPDGAGPGDLPTYDDFEGHGQLIALNHAEPAVVDYVAEVMIHWLDRGADGWRLDAAYAVPLTFWAEVSRRVRERHPDAYLLGEVIHGDYPAFVGEGGLDAVTQYELWQAIRNAIAERNLYELAWTLGRHAEFLDRFVPQTFLGNHDVTRIASAVTAEHLPHALAVLCCTGGTPSVYAGDELGWEAVKEERFGGDDAIRPAFPPAGELRLDGHQRAVLDLHRMLIGVRRRHPWLHTARTTVPELDNTHAVLHSVPDPRTDPEADGVWLDLALNLGDERPNLAVPGSGQLLAGRGELIDPGTDRARVVLPAHGWAVLGPA